MKALWSFEPFHQDKDRIKSMYKTLGMLTGGPAKIDVGFIATHTESSLNQAFDIPEAERFTTYPKKQIKKELKEAQVNINEKNIHVVDFQTYSNSKAADRLFKLASARGADLIGLYTHARKGYIRFAMGSFAETAIHKSRIDLLILNPKCKNPSKIKQVLFASDFGRNSKKEILNLFKYVKNLDSKLTVFHHAEVIYNWSLDESSPKIRAYRKKINNMNLWIKEQGLKVGIAVEVVIASDFNSTSNHVISLLKKNKIDMVAVHAKTGPMAAMMGGSVTRQIVRESPVPVLILKS